MTIRLLTVFLLLGGLACTFTQKIRSGPDAFAVKQYAVAAQLLQDEYNASERLEDQAMRAYMLGQCYEFIRLPDKAAPWYKRAYEHRYGPTALERYADMLRQTEQYALAAEAYQELMASGTDVQRYRGLMTLCSQAEEWKKNKDTNPYKVSSTEFNSPASDYAPFVLGPELLLITSDRQQSAGNSIYNWTGRNFSDLYSVNLATGIVQPFDHVLNTEYNEGTVAMTSDRSEVYFTRCFQDEQYDFYCKIMMCRARGGSWSDAEELPFTLPGVNYGHPALTRNDSILIFSAQVPESAGGFDLYYSVRAPQGWAEPVLLSDRINTIGNERFPSMHEDTLYFSSDHHPGLGGYDIFKSYVDANGQWTPPQNMKAPVNSGWDDFGFVVDTFKAPQGDVLQEGYFSSSRNAQNSDDIYAYRKVKITKPAEEVVVEETEPEIEYRVYLALRTKEPVFVSPDDPNSGRSGTTLLPRTTVEINDGLTMRREVSDANGTIILELAFDEEYKFLAGKKGYLNKTATFSTKDLAKDPDNPIETYNIEIVLEPIFEDTERVMEDIYYDYDEWFIREDARPSLDALTVILKENPALRIQLSSHTDCRGEDDYNEDLSQKRAQSAVDYLVSQGINADRLVAVGYGESRLEVECECTQCTEDEHQQNRRTTFKILMRE